MDMDATRQDGPGTPPELRLASAWADFSKALAIYPESNARVQAQRDALVEQIRERLLARGRDHDPERGLTVLFHDTVVHVEEVEVEVPDGSSVLWLRDRLTHAGLAGIEFLTGVTGDALVAFSKRLLANYLRKESGLAFADLWPEPFDAMVLIDLRFEGTFGGLALDGPYRGGHAGSQLRGAQTNHFVRSLLAHPKVQRRVRGLAQGVNAEDDETVRASTLLRRVLDDVPAEALRSRDALIGAVCGVLDAMQDTERADTPVRSDGGAAATDGEGFAALLYEVSRRHFGREGPGLERLKPDTNRTVEQTPAGGRRRDAEVGDDLDALLTEVDRLPSEVAYDFARGEAESTPEQFAALMHFLTHLEHPESLQGLYPTLAALLKAPGPDELQVLRAYLAIGDTVDAATARGHAAVVRFLLRSGNACLLRTCGVLSPSFVLGDPAARLPLLVAGIDIDADDQRAELDEVCNALGEGLLAYEDALRDDLARLEPTQAAALLRRPSRVRLPLVRCVLAAHPAGPMAEATAFLRALDLPEEEAFLLYQLHDPKLMTRAYLVALIDLHLGRSTREVAQSAIVDLLCRHIRATHGPQGERPERLASIRDLARYPSTKGWELLKELHKTAFGPFGGSEPPAVRRLARTVARQMGEPQADAPLDHLLAGTGDDRSEAA